MLPLNPLPLPIKHHYVADEALFPIFSELEKIYADHDKAVVVSQAVCNQRGVCCDFKHMDHLLYASSLEIAYFLNYSDWLADATGTPKPVKHDECPWFVGGQCEARKGRVLGCRSFFCMSETISSDLYEAHYQRIKELHRKYNLDYLYVPVFKYLQENVS